jgi:hypothetical protein
MMHRLTDAEWRPIKHTFGLIKPSLIVVHETSSRLGKYNCLGYLLGKANTRRVGYHILIERDGTVVQLADLNRKLRHAGRSAWGGRQWCNNFSIGIGLVGPGPLTGTTDKAKSWFRETYTDGLVAGDSQWHGKGNIWLKPTPEQMASLQRVVDEIKELYPSIDICGHYQCSPGRKIDPPPTNVVDLEAIKMSGLGNVGEGIGDLVHETSHDVQIKAEDTHKILSKQSREYKATGAVKKTAVGVGLGGMALEAANIANISATKTYLDTVNAFISSYGVPMLVLACFVGFVVLQMIQEWKAESHEEGRYEPSGEANDAAS